MWQWIGFCTFSFGEEGGDYLHLQFSSVAQSCPTLRPHELQHARPPCPSPTPGVHSNPVHQVSDAIQPSHLSSLLLLPSIFPSIRVFSNESALRIRWPKYWCFSFNISPSNEHPGLISFRMDWIPCSPRNPQESSPTPQFKSINSLVLSFPHSPTLTSIHDHRKNHSLTRRTFVGKVMSLLLICCLGWS